MSPEQVEQSFYEALQTGNLQALMGCWSDDEEPVCIHPGGPRLQGWQAIHTSFGAIFEQGPITVQPDRVHQAMYGTCAVHSVIETVVLPLDDRLLEASIMATNVYVLTSSGWKMAVHHASPAATKPLAHAVSHPQILH
jgi:ketosteroid isomerase-like protein